MKKNLCSFILSQPLLNKGVRMFTVKGVRLTGEHLGIKKENARRASARLQKK